MFHDPFNLKNLTIYKPNPNTDTKSTIFWQSFIQILTYNAIVGATHRIDINFASVLGM
jgi:hypothetical protein